MQATNLITRYRRFIRRGEADRVQGTVRLPSHRQRRKVQNLDLVSGEPMLAEAAKEAVQQWVYRPTLLNGDPVVVVTQVDVNFTLSQ